MKKQRVIAAGCVLLLILIILPSCVSRMFYYPDSKVYGTPADSNLRFEAVTFPSADGTLLSGWMVFATGLAKGTVIHCHGNAQNMTAHFEFVDWLPPVGYNVFCFDYRGYGASKGHPSRDGVFQDTVAAMDYVAHRKDINVTNLIVFGQSLGGANAIAALAWHPIPGVRAIAIDSTFYSYRTMVRDKIALVPVLSWFRTPLSWIAVGNDWSAGPVLDRLPKGVPILFMHGKEDEVIPWQHSQRLYDAATGSKQLWLEEGAGHTEMLMSNMERRRQLLDFFDRAVGKHADAPRL